MKQTFQYTTLAVLVLSLSTFSCNEETIRNEVGESALKKSGAEGLVLFTGEIAVDGCGYMLQVQNQIYKPLNLPSNFEIDSLKVLVDYEVTQNGYQCGLLPTSNLKATINLLQIEKID